MTKIKFKKNTVSIIAYHYVREIKKSNYPNLKGIEYNLYKKQINYFKKNFNIISAEDLNYLLNICKVNQGIPAHYSKSFVYYSTFFVALFYQKKWEIETEFLRENDFALS